MQSLECSCVPEVLASPPYTAQVTTLQGSMIIAGFGGVCYFATVLDVIGSYDVEVLWEFEYSRSRLAIQDLQLGVAPERYTAVIKSVNSLSER